MEDAETCQIMSLLYVAALSKRRLYPPTDHDLLVSAVRLINPPHLHRTYAQNSHGKLGQTYLPPSLSGSRAAQPKDQLLQAVHAWTLKEGHPRGATR